MRTWHRLVALAGVAALICACGGGSGSTGIQGAVGHVKVTITNERATASTAEATGADGLSPSSSPPAAGRSLSVDAGYSGLAHHLQVFDGASYTAELHDCDGTRDTRCTMRTSTAGTAFGAPTPISVGGVPVCLLIDYASDFTGTLDLASGDVFEQARVTVRVHLSNQVDQPCPACITPDHDPQLGASGICAGGRDEGQPCTVDGLADPSFLEFRGTSVRCRPSNEPLGEFTSLATATTGDFVLATSPESPNCRANGSTDRKCLCDVCDDAAATPCHSNVDCPAVGDRPGSCGTTNVGNPTRQNPCEDFVCAAIGDGTGICQNGPIDSHCTVQTFRACETNDDCPVRGDTCTFSPRPCFLDRIALTGTPDVPKEGVAHPTLVGGFCLGTFTSEAANSAGGFPGPVSYVWPAQLEIEQ